MENSKARRGPKPKPDTRNNLIHAGLRLMHAEGYSASGIQGVVEAAGVPKGSFYTYFESKEAFGNEVLEAYSAQGQAKLRSALENAAMSPLARLEGYFDDRIEVFKAAGFSRGCLLGNFSAEAADHSALIRQHLAAHFRSWSALFQTCIAEGQARGEIADRIPAGTLADFVLNSWEGALLRMRAEKSKTPLVEFKEIVFGRVLTP
jgi:TetR/AcrR family transcriptional repressor of nem operon